MSDSRILEIVDIFAGLNSEQLDTIYHICNEKICSQGTVIVKENTPSTEIYIILQGQVEITVEQVRFNEKREKRIGVLDRGQSFGEVALVDEGLRSATVRCISETCRLLEISRSDLLELLKTHPEIGFKVMYNLTADLCLKFRETSFRIR
jgi:CRP/FNR family cyclic AMP-dependent transcriptional regulator